MITWTDVTNLDASLASVPVAAQAAILADCYQILSPVTWGANYDLAVKYLAAHTGVALLRGTGVSGAVTEDHLGDASTSYAQLPFKLGWPSDLASTFWGQRLLFIMRPLGLPIVI